MMINSEENLANIRFDVNNFSCLNVQKQEAISEAIFTNCRSINRSINMEYIIIFCISINTCVCVSL